MKVDYPFKSIQHNSTTITTTTADTNTTQNFNINNITSIAAAATATTIYNYNNNTITSTTTTISIYNYNSKLLPLLLLLLQCITITTLLILPPLLLYHVHQQMFMINLFSLILYNIAFKWFVPDRNINQNKTTDRLLNINDLIINNGFRCLFC